ncbi:hypothetical protein Clacol_001466 [Clathrus columnatus]|uniref:FYVE-type domain-containing protein n=1 Tax=Clathrus columnatus TaxID=1419009 RepID=A0AAV5A3V8_9AGAM|nr:hypothetical protein Clacol_001466 [Clathrus columnatus]
MTTSGPLGTIAESGLSDTQASGTSSLQSSQSLSNGKANYGEFRHDDLDRKNQEDNTEDGDKEEEEEEEEEFIYEQSMDRVTPPLSEEGDDDAEAFKYAVSPIAETVPRSDSPPAVSLSQSIQVSAAQLTSILAAAAVSNFSSFQSQFEAIISHTNVTPFTLANEASPRTGLTVLHVASNKGHLDTLKWLIEDCGAIIDLEDKEGETALHKAALNGHLHIVKYLLSVPDGRPNVHAQDNDGWTPLHNACSRGYFDVVKWLCEHGGAADEIPPQDIEATTIRGVDLKSSNGWTPLMNAASKGHLPIVLYLLNKQSADPLSRNKWGETAYDIAAAVFEIWICEILQKAEAERWSDNNYNTLAVHTTVPIIVYENQRLDTRLKTLAISGGHARFSASGLGRRGRRSPFEIQLPPGSESNGRRDIPAWRSDVQLPLRDDPFQIPKPKANREFTSREGVERSHFWLSDWQLDSTHPKVDVMEGWQYARSFDDPDDQWVSEIPAALERALTRYSALSPGLSSPSSSSSSRASQTQHTWVRRRRWVRVMRRRLDMPPLPYMGPDGGLYLISDHGMLIPRQDEAYDPEGGQELGPVPRWNDDYVTRARYLAGPPPDNEADGTNDLLEVRRSISKLERAVLELRAGMLGDEDVERKIQAEVLLNAYIRQLEQRRSLVGSRGLFTVTDEDIEDEGEDYDGSSDASFCYPGTAESGRPPSIRSHGSDYFSRASTSRSGTDLTPQLSQAPEFRVPTHEAPQNIPSFRVMPIPHAIDAHWERDETVTICRGCSRRFTFLFRKHCRRCGKIYCDRCSSHKAVIDPEHVVRDPISYDNPASSSSSMHRVCNSCHEILRGDIPAKFQALYTVSMERIEVLQSHLAVPNSPRDVNSQISDLADCPVCGQNLAKLGRSETQEAHVRNCLEGPKDASALQQPAKYIVYQLPAESRLVGVECVICLEEFIEGT